MSPPPPARPSALELIGISRNFGSVRALDDVSVTVAAGTIHALLGENGAGKSTLMRVAYGLLHPDAGRVRIFGHDLAGHSVAGAVRAGIGMVHQHLSLVPTLTAAENLALGRRGIFRPRRARDELARLSETSGLHVDPGAIVRDLDIVEQQRIEILKALGRGARVLILDEPTSGLAPPEIDNLLRWVRRFADGGGTVVLVTHRLREALSVADDITVLRRGRVVARRQPGSTDAEELARAIFDERPAAPLPPPPVPGPPVATVQDVGCVDPRGAERLRSASLRINRGDIVGVAAVEGSGHRELLEIIAGLAAPTRGQAHLPARIALVPANRLRDGLVADFTLVENVALRGAGARRGRMPWGELSERTRQLITRFSIVASSPAARASELSGGNQQRLVIARELSEAVDLVVADDPARGLDLRATEFVFEQLRHAAGQGAGIVVHSPDLDHLLAIATRVVVVFHGTVREVSLSRDAIGRAMLGGDAR